MEKSFLPFPIRCMLLIVQCTYIFENNRPRHSSDWSRFSLVTFLKFNILKYLPYILYKIHIYIIYIVPIPWLFFLRNCNYRDLYQSNWWKDLAVLKIPHGWVSVHPLLMTGSLLSSFVQPSWPQPEWLMEEPCGP